MRLSSRFPVEQISASSLAKFVKCPEQWRLRYVERHKDRTYTDRFVGLIDHKVWEFNFREKLRDGEDLGIDWLRGKLRAEWAILKQKEQPDFGNDDEEKLIKRSLKMLEVYEPVATRIQPIAVEERFEETIPGVPVPLVGYVDIEEQLQVLERKTSKNRVSKPKSEWRFQGRIYQLVKRKPVEWHVVTKQVTPQVCTAQTDPDLYLPIVNPDATVRMIQQTVEAIGEFYARWPEGPWPTNGIFGDWACDYCFAGPRYAASCHVWKESDDQSLAA